MTLTTTSVPSCSDSGTKLLHAHFTGKNGSGAITISGLAVGDFLLKAILPSTDLEGKFEDIVTTANQLQQLTSEDYSGLTFDAIFIRIS